jgi:lipopolysaccharide transport system permease protein
VLEAGRAERHYWADLWRYRELFAILAWRDLAVRYKQTAIGVAWAVIRPLLMVAIFTVVYGRVAHLQSEGAAPYSVMVFAGTIAWFLVSTILSEGANSLVTNSNLIGKVYFPRLIVPSATILVALVDAAITFVLLLVMMLWHRFLPDWRIVFLPAFVLLGVIASLGPALLMAAMNVKYRDFRYIIPFVLQFGVYVSPVGFSSSQVPEQWRLLYSINPAVGVIDGFRWALLRGQAELYVPGFVTSIVASLFLLAVGIAYFRRAERTFADLV